MGTGSRLFEFGSAFCTTFIKFTYYYGTIYNA